MRAATVLHTADVHLGTSAAGPDGSEEQAFSRAIDAAIDHDVDAVLIAGDLFDHGRVSEELLSWTAKQIDRACCPVVLLVGNHDALHSKSIHYRFDPVERCEQVSFLGEPEGSTLDVPGTDITVWGRAMVEHAPWFRPLAGVPTRPADRWAVVMAHGLVIAGDRRTHHGSPMSEAEIDAIDWDYVALGHCHGHKVIREAPCPVVYPGATARSRQGAPGAVIVELAPSGTRFEWISLASSI